VLPCGRRIVLLPAQTAPMTVRRWCLVRSVDDAMWFQEHGYEARAEISWDIAKAMLADL